MNLDDRQALHDLLTEWLAANDYDPHDATAAELVDAIEQASLPTRTETESGTAAHHRTMREIDDQP